MSGNRFPAVPADRGESVNWWWTRGSAASSAVSGSCDQLIVLMFTPRSDIIDPFSWVNTWEAVSLLTRSFPSNVRSRLQELEMLQTRTFGGERSVWDRKIRAALSGNDDDGGCKPLGSHEEPGSRFYACCSHFKNQSTWSQTGGTQTAERSCKNRRTCSPTKAFITRLHGRCSTAARQQLEASKRR